MILHNQQETTSNCCRCYFHKNSSKNISKNVGIHIGLTNSSIGLISFEIKIDAKTFLKVGIKLVQDNNVKDVRKHV